MINYKTAFREHYVALENNINKLINSFENNKSEAEYDNDYFSAELSKILILNLEEYKATYKDALFKTFLFFEKHYDTLNWDEIVKGTGEFNEPLERKLLLEVIKELENRYTEIENSKKIS